MADRPKRELKKTKRSCNEYSTYTPVRKANPRKKNIKLYDVEIDDIKSIPRARFQLAKKCIKLPSATITSFLDSFLTEDFLSDDF